MRALPTAPVAAAHRRVARALRAGSVPTGVDGLRHYLGSALPVLGVSVPRLRSVVRDTALRISHDPPSRSRALARSLWHGPTYEERLVAIELMDRRPLVEDASTWRLIAAWVDDATGWALSDSLAAGPVASHLSAHPERFRELLRWTRSTNLWRRRASAYALRAWVRAGELDRPFRLLERLLDDPDRWVQRAVGTWLRECWKKDPARTERFLRRKVARLAPVTITVATERATGRFREELRRSARRRHRALSAGRRRF